MGSTHDNHIAHRRILSEGLVAQDRAFDFFGTNAVP